MPKDVSAMIAVFIGFMGMVLAVSCDYASSTWQYESDAIVIDRSYTPSSSSTVVVDGKVGTTYDSEKWMVIVEMNGRVVTFHVDADVWQRSEKGRKVSVYKLRGKLLEYGVTLS